jgi:hypothetical protein
MLSGGISTETLWSNDLDSENWQLYDRDIV